MKSEASDVSLYLAAVPEERRDALSQLRALCLAELKGYDEVMDYGMPCYKKGGVMDVSFASQKQYIGLYILKKDVLDRHRAEFVGCSVGKGCICFKLPKQMDFVLIKRMLRETVASAAAPCA